MAALQDRLLYGKWIKPHPTNHRRDMVNTAVEATSTMGIRNFNYWGVKLERGQIGFNHSLT